MREVALVVYCIALLLSLVNVGRAALDVRLLTARSRWVLLADRAAVSLVAAAVVTAQAFAIWEPAQYAAAATRLRWIVGSGLIGTGLCYFMWRKGG
jgi:hypothetical protein